MQQFDLSWYEGVTDKKFADVTPGSVLTYQIWSPTSEQDGAMRVLTEPFARTTWHGNVDHSTHNRGEWLEFQVVYGELVFNHSAKLFGEPDWRVYPEGLGEPPAATPAVVVWRTEREPHLIPVASIWWGEPGQDAEEFRQQVLAELPQPLAVEERFALREGTPVTVLVVAEQSEELTELLGQLNHPLVTVKAAHSAEETLAKLNGTDVIIVADELPIRAGEQPVRTYCAGFIRDGLVQLDIPLIGWPVNVLRRRNREDNPDLVTMHLQAECGQVLGAMPERGRVPLHHVLDALGVHTTYV
ncbi:MAG TPA: hypothetical protein VFO38_06460 [Candidatus Saccharimonadales bacterium]|nr:hypothetical protein [Candidatus Saccharimonadales bacterium]